MSQQISSPGKQVQKQRLNVYTMMLIISFIAIVTACVLLYYELTLYGSYPWWNAESARPATSSYNYPVELEPTVRYAMTGEWRSIRA